MIYEYKTRFLPAGILCDNAPGALAAEIERAQATYDIVLNEMAREKWELVAASPAKFMQGEGKPHRATACIFRRQWHRPVEEPVLRD